jgi:hypothetical protein
MFQRIVQYSLLLLALAPAFNTARAQGKLKFFDACATKTAFLLTTGDTIVIRCDSTVMMTSPTFRIYEAAHEQFRRRSPNTGELIKSYEALVARQDSMIFDGQRDYNALKLKFDTLYFTSLNQMNKTSEDIGVVKENLSNVTTNLNNTQVLITDAIDKVNTARRKSFLDKLYWGVGGLGIGVAVTAVLMGIN